MAREIIITGERDGRRFIKGYCVDVGSFGSVFNSHEYGREHGEPYAMKLPEPIDNEEYADKLTWEAEYQRQFLHPHITRVVHFDTTRSVLPTRSVPFLITPRAQGNLYSSIMSASLTLNEAVDVSEHTADALSEIHRKGFVHRDIKPSNVLLKRDQQRRLKGELTDFGEAVTLEKLAANPPKHNFSFNERYSSLTEQFAWAQNIVYPTIIGIGHYPVNPFVRLSFESMLPRGKMTVLHETVETVVDKAMQQDPLQRYQSMAVLLDDLRERRARATEAQQRDRKYL